MSIYKGRDFKFIQESWGMAKKSLIAKAKRKPKFSTRTIRRCFRCGRIHGYIRDFGLCRICFRELTRKGEIPGVRRSSW